MAVLQSALEKEGEKREKKVLSQDGVLVFGHPSKYELRRKGLNFVERKKPIAVPVV